MLRVVFAVLAILSSVGRVEAQGSYIDGKVVQADSIEATAKRILAPEYHRVFKKAKLHVEDETGWYARKKVIVSWRDTAVSVRYKNWKDGSKWPGYEGTYSYAGMSDVRYSPHNRPMGEAIAEALVVDPLQYWAGSRDRWVSFRAKRRNGTVVFISMLVKSGKERKAYRELLKAASVAGVLNVTWVDKRDRHR